MGFFDSLKSFTKKAFKSVKSFIPKAPEYLKKAQAALPGIRQRLNQITPMIGNLPEKVRKPLLSVIQKAESFMPEAEREVNKAPEAEGQVGAEGNSDAQE